MRKPHSFVSIKRWASLAYIPLLLVGCTSGPTRSQMAGPASDAAESQMRSRNYLAAASNYREAIAIDPDTHWRYSQLGDALVLQGGDISEASMYYAKAWALELQQDYDSTKGDPFWLKAMMFAATVGAAAGTDYYNAQNGIQSNSVRGGIDTYRRMDLENATGAKDFRKIVKAAISDLKGISTNSHSSIQVCKPSFAAAPCAGMYRLIAGSRICPVVRTDVGVFAAPLKCLDGNISDYLRVDGSGMNSDHYYPLIECFTDSGGASCNGRSDNSYAFLASRNKSKWRPAWRSGGLGQQLLVSDKIVAASYDQLFGRIVPIVTTCEAWLPNSLRCARPPKDWSAVYMRLSQQVGDDWEIGMWYFAGFLSPEGTFVSQSAGSRAAMDAKRLHDERVTK